MAADTEHDNQATIMLKIQRVWPDALVLRQNTGVAFDRSGRAVKFGTPGQADIRAVIRGMAVEIEAKSATGRQTVKQKRYQRAFERAGGIYLICRDPQDTISELIERVYSGKHN